MNCYQYSRERYAVQFEVLGVQSTVTKHEVQCSVQKCYEKSENIIGLDPYILNSFSHLDPI